MAYTNGIFYLDPVSGSDTARTALTSVTASNPSGSITRCNKTAHGLVTGAVVDLTAFSSWLNDAWKITVVDADNFNLDSATWQATADTSGTATPRGGSSKADAWKTITLGPTTARIQPLDTIRTIRTGAPTSTGNSATWTANSRTVSLSASLTQNISDCEAAWTASSNVTSTADGTLYKENTKSAKHVIASGFTTGLASYRATGLLDLSTYQQVSFWIQNTAAIADGATLSLRLCSDTIGAVSVRTVAIPAIPSINQWVPITVDIGANLPSVVNSVALYCDTDPGTITVYLDNIIACKASSSADSLTLTSLISKIWNLYWVATTAYATNDIRKPTPPNRNGYRYKVTAGGGGNSGSSEPTWPRTIGATVTDGSLTWTCEGLEDTWYAIQSINGTTIKIDNATATLGNAGRGYSGSTESPLLYKRETYKTTMASVSSIVLNAIQDSGDATGNITFTGGWNTTDMTTQDGETWWDGQNGFGYMFSANSKTLVTMENMNCTRAYYGLYVGAGGLPVLTVNNCHFNNTTDRNIEVFINCILTVSGLVCNNGGAIGFFNDDIVYMLSGSAFTANGNISHGFGFNGSYIGKCRLNDVVAKNNGGYGFQASKYPLYLSGFITGSNVSGGLNPTTATMYMFNCSIPESTEFNTPTTSANAYYYSMKHDQTADNHLITTDGGTIISATDQRNTASGISWKFRPTSTNRNTMYPLEKSVARVAVTANNQVTLSIACRRDNTNIQGELLVRGGQIAGVGGDLSVALAPSINTWASSSNLTFTPTENGVVEVVVQVWDGVGTTNALWVDDIVISQA